MAKTATSSVTPAENLTIYQSKAVLEAAANHLALSSQGQ